MNTDEVIRDRFELNVKNSKVHNNQMIKRHALNEDKYQYDSVQFAWECYQQARKESEAEILGLRENLELCKHQASYSIGDSEALSNQLSKVRSIATKALKEANTQPGEKIVRADNGEL